MDELTGEDAKLVVLARSTRNRAGAGTGAALRDTDGRTYASVEVQLPSLQVSAIGVAIAMAAAGGSRGVEAVVLLGETDPDERDVAAIREFGGAGRPVYAVDPQGRLRTSTTS